MMESPEAFIAHMQTLLASHWQYVFVVLLLVIAYLAGQLRGVHKASNKTTSIQLRPIGVDALEVVAGPQEALPAIYEEVDE